jgi:alpha-1,3-rhamnosyl/mannosyltransferase
MIPVLHPEWFDDTTPFQRALASVEPHDHVFADSECTRADLLRLRGLDPQNVHVAYPGISSHFAPLPRDACRAELVRLGLPPVRFLLAVGTLEPRKNLASLLDAFALLAVRPEHADLHLVLTGARGWRNEVFDAALARLGPLRARVLATGFLADADLPVLYGACEAFVFPSLYEGFGLPIAEAMACGAAVACVSNSSQPEVAGDVAVLARDTTSGAIAESVTTLLSDPEALETRRARGPAQAGRFTWKACVDRHLEVWREDGGHSP